MRNTLKSVVGFLFRVVLFPFAWWRYYCMCREYLFLGLALKWATIWTMLWLFPAMRNWFMYRRGFNGTDTLCRDINRTLDFEPYKGRRRGY